jgi:hypothetical protein
MAPHCEQAALPFPIEPHCEQIRAGVNSMEKVGRMGLCFLAADSRSEGGQSSGFIGLVWYNPEKHFSGQPAVTVLGTREAQFHAAVRGTWCEPHRDARKDTCRRGV